MDTNTANATQVKTMFEKVVEFNKSFGVKLAETPNREIFTKDPKLVDYRMSLIQEEFTELQDAVKAHDFVETIDALTDIMYVTLGMFTALGVDADKAYDIVHSSNMSKLCKTEEEAIETVENYKKNDDRYDSPAYRKSDDGNYYVVYNESTGKILKSIRYTPANFESIIN